MWGGDDAAAGLRPARIDAVVVELPGLAGRRNLTALHLARLFDDAAWREAAFEIIAGAVGGEGVGPGRIALPAVLGLADHARALDDARRLLPLTPFEVPLMPPSIPGMRLYDALRSALRRRGGRVSIGEQVVRVGTAGRRVTEVAIRCRGPGSSLPDGGHGRSRPEASPAAGSSDGTMARSSNRCSACRSRRRRWRTGSRRIRSIPPAIRSKLAGIRTDAKLRPVDGRGKVVFENVAIVGSMLAGQRYLAERCGDGVADRERAAGGSAVFDCAVSAAPGSAAEKAAATR